MEREINEKLDEIIRSLNDLNTEVDEVSSKLEALGKMQ